jgi:hypothetical protein
MTPKEKALSLLDKMDDNKKLDIDSYKKYMKVVEDNIKETESRIKMLSKYKKVIKLPYDDWVRFQKGELKL